MPDLSNRHPIERRALLLLAATLALLILIYLPTLLTRPAGGETAYMDDVGEIQVALNTWGTIHHTGYPLFAILGNLTVGLLRLVGISPATAPALHSLLWGLVALVAFYLLIVRLTGRMQIAAALTLLLRVTRAHWSVENSLHWVLDVVFHEDACRVRRGAAAQNFAILRHAALNLLKQEHSTTVGIKAKRLKVALSEAYLLKVLGV